jgi:hypothetical protein
MDEIQSRDEAIRRYLAEEHPAEICHALGYSNPWLYKWLKRDDPMHPGWVQSRSRAPHHLMAKTSPVVERLVCEIRQRLVQTRDAQRRALAIQWQLQPLGVPPLPKIWTIHRILHRHGLVGKRPYHQVHQLDLVGPRDLTGGERFYGVHLIDVYSHAVALAAVPSKQAPAVVEALVAGWQKLGCPRDLQVDHALSVRGSNRHPRSFGLLICLCLYVGVEVVFSPSGSPGAMGSSSAFTRCMTSSSGGARPSATGPTWRQSGLASKPSIILSVAMRRWGSTLAGRYTVPTAAGAWRLASLGTGRASRGVRAASRSYGLPTHRGTSTSFASPSQWRRPWCMSMSKAPLPPARSISHSFIRGAGSSGTPTP